MNLKLFVALGLAALLAACGPSESTDSTEAEASESPTPMETESMTQESDPLTGTNWQVEDIDGRGVIDRSKATIQFPEPGRVAGNASCNRYMGGYERDGDSLSFGNLAGTMMACPEPLMNQEQRFHQAMGQVTGWRIDPATDLLHLVDESDNTVIRASRLPTEDGAAN